MTSPPEPRNRVLQRIDDMGTFRAEYPGIESPWFRLVFALFFSGCLLVLVPSLCYSLLDDARNANPREVSGFMILLLFGIMFVMPVAMILFFVNVIRHIRKYPLVYGLFEEGFVVVCRNKTFRKIFWDEISRIRIITRGKKPPRIAQLILEISTPEQWTETRKEYVSAELFRNGKELCRDIVDSVPHAEKREKPVFTKRELLIVLASIAVLVPGMYCLGEYIRSRGSVSKNWQIQSKITGETMRFSVYLPPGYDTELKNGRRYPVLYLLHGFRDNHTSWPEHGELRRIADETIRNGKAVPMVIIMPHALGGFYGNGTDERNRYEDYFFTELIPLVEKRFKLRTDKEHRAIAGISMGGQGAFYYAMKYPEMFAACCPMGGAFHFNDLAAVQIDLEITDVGNDNDLGLLLQKTSERQKMTDPSALVRFYFDCGEQDGLIKINRDLDAKMRELDIPHEFRTRPGGHDWKCWQDALPDVLQVVSTAFGR
ncbi:MAG: esterase family protein [Planctomycetaceae bacterium]|nr:esterase family protein [Planctomycetaceae bacterium]